MKYLSFQLTAGAGSSVVVTIDHAANVLLLDDANFQRFRRGVSHHYLGGWYTTSPVQLIVPNAGVWHVVVHLGGRTGRVNAQVKVDVAA